MVRFARDTGSMHELYPAGITRLMDLPVPLYSAIRHGLQFASFDEYPEEERPPKAIWMQGKKLKAWFEAVRKKRVKGDKDEVEIEDPVENQLGKALRRSVG